jgi:mRNA-degrading endonuclease RelE of RelBE toxin-antitoxin system
VYRVRILDAAMRELARLDKPLARRIIERITWLATNLDTIVNFRRLLTNERRQSILQ